MVHMHDGDIHEHEHAHGDGQVHTHSHSHNESHTHTAGTIDMQETKALLAYMIHHNDHHAEELAGLLGSLPKNAQKKLTIAIGTFEAANVELQEVLACLE